MTMVCQLSFPNQGHRGLVGPWSNPTRNVSMKNIAGVSEIYEKIILKQQKTDL
jgi:hypothetical protein